MDFKVVWTEPAIANLHEIVCYVAQSSPEAALKLGEALIAHVEILESFPSIGPIYRRARTRNVREVVCRNYRLFYRIKSDPPSVEILHVRHTARDEPLNSEIS